MANAPSNPIHVAVCGDVVAEHECPVCGTTVEDLYRPGRHRIYCTNACRQRAYRWRRANGVRMCVERNGPAESLFNDRMHARRDHRDPVAGVRDRREREMSVCGTFAKPLRHMRRLHNQFVPESNHACESCIALIGVGPWGTGIPDVVRGLWSDRYDPRWGEKPRW